MARPAGAFTTRLRYTDRKTKAVYIADKYAPILIGSVLEVGCEGAALRKLVHQPFRYIGVDVHPGSDRVVDLDRDNLPFGDRHFDTAVCTDVLEHLERCHAMFDELCRVSRGHVIVSLPNPMAQVVQSLIAGGGGRSRHYGLPAERPHDRYRWFFGHEEAAEFVAARGRKGGFEVVQIDTEEGPAVMDGRGRILPDHPNVVGGTMWFVLKRSDGSAK